MANKVTRNTKLTSTSKTGYREIWNMGKASNAKKKWKLSKPNRPSI